MNKIELSALINNAFQEDLGNGDHSSLACISSSEKGKAKLLVKQEGVLAGIEVAQEICKLYDDSLVFTALLKDGAFIKQGDIAFYLEGKVHSILACERLILNCMQRMSGIATYTNYLVSKIKPHAAQLLDTRKTTPNFRLLEKEAVKIGGGVNHRFGLYDMIMLKDNHIDYAGGIKNAIAKTNQYLKSNQLNLKIEVEVRDIKELKEVLEVGDIDRIMLDNFTPSDMKKAVDLIAGRFQTEASGGITENTIEAYAATGVDYISVGALTHQVKSLDLSLKAC